MKKNKTSKDKGNDFEKECERTINSGAFFRDHDLSTSEKVIECKFTEQKGFRISTKLLEILYNDSLDANKFPYLIIGIKDGTTQWTIKCDITKEMKP